ncbi:MAG: hypothetical protein MZW92_36635 [Comamonadaceae bacterium]|nr:hypothetical protein [Comamonadaceae bacterium]
MMVNADDPALRANRLALLARLHARDEPRRRPVAPGRPERGAPTPPTPCTPPSSSSSAATASSTSTARTTSRRPRSGCRSRARWRRWRG